MPKERIPGRGSSGMEGEKTDPNLIAPKIPTPLSDEARTNPDQKILPQLPADPSDTTFDMHIPGDRENEAISHSTQILPRERRLDKPVDNIIITDIQGVETHIKQSEPKAKEKKFTPPIDPANMTTVNMPAQDFKAIIAKAESIKNSTVTTMQIAKPTIGEKISLLFEKAKAGLANIFRKNKE